MDKTLIKALTFDVFGTVADWRGTVIREVSDFVQARGLETVASLSNGNVALLTNLSKHADLRWDCILSSELARHYKPDSEVYLTAAGLLGLSPDEIMMVAAHNNDLLAARAVGFKTAFVYRTTEYGPGQTSDLELHL